MPFSEFRKLLKPKDILSVLIVPIVAISFAMVIGGVVIALIGLEPLSAYSFLLQGSLGSKQAIGETIVKMTPLIFTGLSFALASRCGLTNIGAEGQLYMGGFLATAVGIYLNGLPMIIHLPLAIIAGFIGGGLWGLLAGFLKVKFGASEIITTIMLNYIAINFISYLVSGPMTEPPGNMPQTPRVLTTAVLPRIFSGTRVHLGFIIALAAILIYYIFLWKTTVGFETRVVGLNSDAAKYAGMNTNSKAILAMFISGGFAGLAGVSEILGVQFRMFQNFSPGYGFDGIAVALLGQNSPIGILLSGFLFGVLRAGSNLMQMSAKVPAAIIYIIQALILMFIVGSEIFKIIQKKRKLRTSEK